MTGDDNGRAASALKIIVLSPYLRHR